MTRKNERQPLEEVAKPISCNRISSTHRSHYARLVLKTLCIIAITSFLLNKLLPHWRWPYRGCHRPTRSYSPYGSFPQRGDPFHFMPCTRDTLPPALDDLHPGRTWAKRFDPDPRHWSWGNITHTHEEYLGEFPHLADEHQPPYHPPLHPPHGLNRPHRDPYSGRGIYLCGYLDVPLDYTNKFDTRIARLAVTKYQVSGLARRHLKRPRHHKVDGTKQHRHNSVKSERTIVVEPGGPGGSGTLMAWRCSEELTKRLSDGKYDVLG